MRYSDALRDAVDEKVQRLGCTAYEAGLVHDLIVEPDKARVLVDDTYDTFRVRLYPHPDDPGVIGVACTCRTSRSNVCPHIWAAILAFDEHRERMSQPDWRRALQQVVDQAPLRRAPSTRNAANGSWLWQWVIDVEATIERKSLVVATFVQTVRRDQSLAPLKPRTIFDGYVDRCGDERDRCIIRLLRGWYGNDTYGSPYYYYSSWSRRGTRPDEWSVEIDNELYDIVLPMMAETGRLSWSTCLTEEALQAFPVTYHPDRRYRPMIRITEASEGGHWEMETIYQAQGDYPNRGAGDLVLDIGRGWLLFGDELAGNCGASGDVATSGPPRAPVAIPFEERDVLMAELVSAADHVALELPESLRWQETRPAPRPCLRVPSSAMADQFVHAQIWFDYNGHQARFQHAPHSFFAADGALRILRNPEEESRWVAALPDSWQHARTDVFEAASWDVRIRAADFSAAVMELRAAGWTVEADGRPMRMPGTMSVSVHSGVDWFDLEARVDFEGTTVPLPDLLAALREKRQTIQLGDGSVGMLPEAWLAKYAGWGQLGEATDGMLRFRQSQSLLLDALLAGESNVQSDETFQKLRDRIASFQGVQHADPAPSFRGKLRAYQREGLGWLQFLESFGLGGCLADDMGLGKTIQLLAHLQTRRASDPKKTSTSLVVVPKSLVFNWIEEAQRFTPNLRVANYTGTGRDAIRERFSEYDLVVTTYGTLRRDILQMKDFEFDYVVLDESQAIKNAQSQAAKSCRLLKARHRLTMTGTPIENHLGELWSQFEFLNPGLLGRNEAFQQTLKRPDPDSRISEFISRALRPYILRRTKQQVLTELPEKNEQTVYCELGKKERKAYDELRNYYRRQLDKTIAEKGLQKAKIHVLEALLRLRQAACHPGLIDAKRAKEPSAKVDQLLEQLDEVLSENHKALVFSQFTSLLDIVRQRLDKKKIVYEYLDGRTRNRQAKVERFQTDPACPLFLISLRAGGVGLNLTAAEYVFILDPWWNPAVESQAIDRAHRIGQTQPVFAYRLIARDTVEEKVLALQQSKRELANAIIRADASLIRSLTAEDLQLLLS